MVTRLWWNAWPPCHKKTNNNSIKIAPVVSLFHIWCDFGTVVVLSNVCNSLLLIKLRSRGVAKPSCGNNNRWNVNIHHHAATSDILFSLPVSHSTVGSSATRVLKSVISSRWQSGISLITFPKSSWRSGYTTTLRAGRDADRLGEEKRQPWSTRRVSSLSYFQKWDFQTNSQIFQIY